MDKTYNIWKGAVVLSIVAIMVFSSVAIANTKTKDTIELFGTGHGVGPGARGNVVWDNGMHYEGFVASQWDPIEKLDPIGADDFQFEETTVVTDVHWIGGYWNPLEDGDFDWNVSFYRDRGDDMAPGGIVYKQVFSNAEVHETLVETAENGLYFSYYVDLEQSISFPGGEKYWISIQGLGTFPPQSHWSGHGFPIYLHQAKFKSDYFSFPDWIDISEITGGPSDACFQLTGDGEPVEPDLECEGDIRLVDVPPGSTVNATFTVMNNGDFGSILEWTVEEKPEWGDDWIFIPEAGFVGTEASQEVYVQFNASEEKNKEFTGEIKIKNENNNEDTCIISVYCKTPRSRTISVNPMIRLFEQFPNILPILRHLFEFLY